MIFLYRSLRIFLLLFWGFSAWAQTSTENYVLSRTYRTTGGAVTEGTKYWGTPAKVKTQVSYTDNLGKSSYDIVVAGNPDEKDLLIRRAYDNMHQLSKEYLPVNLPNGSGKIPTAAELTTAGGYYNGENVGAPTTNYWTETVYDNSPLGRVKATREAGVSGEDTGVRKAYLTNSPTNGSIRFYKLSGTEQILPTTPVNYYDDGALNIVETKDEVGNRIEQFTDKQGRLVLKRVAGQQDTYYVYNDQGQLRYVLQPQFQDAGADVTARIEKFAFEYTYDEQGRLKTKRIPGQGTFTIEAYYPSDMIKQVLDARGKRFYYKYDDLNRQIEMGEGTIGVNETLYVKTKYDDYAGIPNVAFDNALGLTDDDDFKGLPASDSKKGLTTMTTTRVLDGTFNNPQWLNTLFFYDKKGRLIQVQRQLYSLGGNSKEQISYQRDFEGNVTRELTTQWSTVGTYNLDKTFKYDHQSRLESVKHSFYLNSGAPKTYTHVVNGYNAVGLASEKSFHDDIQKIDYKYTPRGWLHTLQNDGGKGYLVNLRYQPNGNVSSLAWQTPGYSGSFDSFTYDGANRMTDAVGAPYKEHGITYDKNGNIFTLKRDLENGPADELVYQAPIGEDQSNNYQGNRLIRVVDKLNNSAGFDNGASGTGADYTYDGNGNMLSDQNRGVTDVVYNALNLPEKVTMVNPGRILQYVYDASGNKLRLSAPGATTVYAGAFEYNSSGTLLRIELEEGQLVRKSDGTYEVQYYLRDHLGNVRVVLDEGGEVVQETEYLPFGLAVNRTGSDADNKYHFLGKEIQQETNWVDLQARFFDPVIGRFMVVDPETGGQEDFSPYHYSFDNPLLYSDPDGRAPECCKGLGDFLTGVGSALNDDIWGGNPVQANPGHVQAYNNGRKLGHYLSATWGSVEIAIGGAGIAGAVAVTAGTAGAATPATAVAGTASAGLVAHGGNTVMNAMDNLQDDKGAVNTHGNTLDNKPAEGYSLRDRTTGDVKKYGETTRGDDKFGAGKQKRYTKKELKAKNVDYVKEVSGTKKSMHKWQTKKIRQYKKKNNGKRPDYNKTDY